MKNASRVRLWVLLIVVCRVSCSDMVVDYEYAIVRLPDGFPQIYLGESEDSLLMQLEELTPDFVQEEEYSSNYDSYRVDSYRNFHGAYMKFSATFVVIDKHVVRSEVLYYLGKPYSDPSNLSTISRNSNVIRSDIGNELHLDLDSICDYGERVLSERNKSYKESICCGEHCDLHDKFSVFYTIYYPWCQHLIGVAE